MLLRSMYSASIAEFIRDSSNTVLGVISTSGGSGSTQQQFFAWESEIDNLKVALLDFVDSGHIHFEFDIPRLGRRIDVLCIIENALFVLEFKVGQSSSQAARDQALDYALDLKHFHNTSHSATIFPIVVSDTASSSSSTLAVAPQEGVFDPIECTVDELGSVITLCLARVDGDKIDAASWQLGEYHPTPTIIEAASRLYAGHAIEDISRSDAGAIGVTRTTGYILDVVHKARENKQKAICFVTGVPGAGKTLVGLDIAAKRRANEDEHSVYLSGNGPLVAVIREALIRDAVERSKTSPTTSPLNKTRAGASVKAFIQNVHHFRDECLRSMSSPPFEHVAIFDEAQRAWDQAQAQSFMKRRKGLDGFKFSEAEFLISCMERHPDWAVIVCLVGGGQEIHTGEAGISSWLTAIKDRFPDWHVHISPELTDAEYNRNGSVTEELSHIRHVVGREELHLSVSMRSYRAESLSKLVKSILDIDHGTARTELKALSNRYPIKLTRSIEEAKDWTRTQARGNQRFGMVVSSHAQRLKPHAINVTAPMNPIHWFLNDKMDTRSSYFLEDVATEFHIQGLELDWSIVAWDADFRFHNNSWQHWSFRGKAWERINKHERKAFQLNAYRVLLTRARLGMVIVVPEGSTRDHTRKPEYYDPTYEYLQSLGFETL